MKNNILHSKNLASYISSLFQVSNLQSDVTELTKTKMNLVNFDIFNHCISTKKSKPTFEFDIRNTLKSK